MSHLSDMDAITSQFKTRSEDMPRISTSSTKPNYTSLKNFQDALDANAMSVMSYSTELGHLALTRKPEEFTAANNNVSFVTPTNPGNAPTLPSMSTRSSPTDPFEAQEVLRLFKFQQAQYTRYRNTSTALKNCIINAVDDEYTEKLKKKITGYATVTPLELLTHLWTNYGEVGENDLKPNEARMKAQWNPPTPIETLFKQLENGQEFAAEGNEKIDDSILVRYGYDNVVATGVFTKYCTKWRERASDKKSWDEFRECFTKWDKERTDSMTTEEASYSANKVQELVQAGIAKEMESMQNHMAAWCQAISDETTNANQPPPSPPAPSAAMNALTEADLDKIVNRLKVKSTLAPTTYTNVAQGKDDKGRDITYCHTHGWTRNLDHNSKTCTRRAEGHKEAATLTNKMGGYDGQIKYRKSPTKK